MSGPFIKVSAYSGYKGNERPVAFIAEGQRHEVRRIISRWAEPDRDFFRVMADDERVYTLSWNREADQWALE